MPENTLGTLVDSLSTKTKVTIKNDSNILFTGYAYELSSTAMLALNSNKEIHKIESESIVITIV